MRIAHVVYSCVPECFRGGVPKAVFELSTAQAALGHEVDVYTTTFNSAHRTDISAGTVRSLGGVSIRYFDVRRPRWFSSPELSVALGQNVETYDVVHGHNTYLALNRYAARAAGGRARLFFHVHGALDPIIVKQGLARRVRKELYIRLVERSNLDAASGVIALTENERDQLLGWGVRSPIHVVPNGVRAYSPNPDSARAFRQAFGLVDSETLIVFLGRIVPKKAIHVLIEAFARASASRDACRLVIAGDRNQDPEYVTTLDRLAEERGIARKIIWPGFIDEERKQGLLAAASLFSHVTESEGMAVAPLEAMAAGLPTVVSDNCYMDAAAKHGALLQVGCDVASLSQALSKVLDSPALAALLKTRAAAYVAQHHSWPQIATQIVSLYAGATLCGGRN